MKSAHVKCQNRSDTSNNTGDWNRLTVTQTIPEQQNGKARNQGTAENSNIGHCPLTAGSADVEVHNVFNIGNNIACRHHKL